MLGVFREELARLESREATPAAVSARFRALVVALDELSREAPGDARRALRRLADGTLGRVRMPELESLVARGARGLERLAGGVVAGSFVVGGALLAGLGGWHHVVGIALLSGGILLAVVIGLGALRRGGGG